MYVAGHVVTSLASGLFDAAAMCSRTGALSLMLPDVLQAHRWGYAQCFAPLPAGLPAHLVRAHVLGDWFAHFGAGRDPVRRGWAYRCMAPFVRQYDAFFAGAARQGLRTGAPPGDSRRGFAHTMVEYALELHVANSGAIRAHFPALRRSLGSAPQRMRREVAQLAAATGAIGEAADVAANITSFTQRIAASTHECEWALHAGVKKFGLLPGAAAMAHVGRTIAAGLAEIGNEALDAALAATGAFIGRELRAAGATPWT